MNYISDVLFWISTGMLVPVIILLLIFFIRALLLAGSFFGQYMNMRKQQNTIVEIFENIKKENLKELNNKLPQHSTMLLVIYAKKMLEVKDSEAHINRLLSQYEILAAKELELPSTLSKIGPVLGLMGTLIPMGPALVGLSNGDIASMAYNMQVAFATTVVGLFSGAVGVVIHQIKKRWKMQTLTQLEFLAEIIATNHE